MQVKIATTRKPETPQAGYNYSPFRMFEDFYRDWYSRIAPAQSEPWKPSVDILEKDGKLLLRVEIPGVNEKDIDLKLEGAVLTIKGERKQDFDSEQYNFYQVESCYGSFSRSFTLPETVDTDTISAQHKNGILTITLPQKPEVKPRSIKVNG